MRAYANRPPDQITENTTNDVANAISLRDDIHRAFDSAFFVIARKQGRWVAHFWKRTVEIGRTYHNRLLNIHPAVHPCFLLARFAWSLFPLLSSFVQKKQKRRIRVYTTVEGEQEHIEANEVDIINIIKDKAKSETSTKRKQTSVNEDSLRKRVCDGGPQSDSGIARTSFVVPHNANPFAMGAHVFGSFGKNIFWTKGHQTLTWYVVITTKRTRQQLKERTWANISVLNVWALKLGTKLWKNWNLTHG